MNPPDTKRAVVMWVGREPVIAHWGIDDMDIEAWPEAIAGPDEDTTGVRWRDESGSGVIAGPGWFVHCPNACMGDYGFVWLDSDERPWAELPSVEEKR